MTPLVGITADVYDRDGRLTCRVADAYAECVQRAGGVPVVLPPRVESVEAIADRLDAAVFTGGDDPIMEAFGGVTQLEATPVHSRRQAFELALMRILRTRGTPTLGVCLGMQYMGLIAGGRLEQHLTGQVADTHRRGTHAIVGSAGWAFGDGPVHSAHHQAIIDPGSLGVLARAEDGVIEAVGDLDARFWIGVQWHPERTRNDRLGQALFDALVRAAGC